MNTFLKFTLVFFLLMLLSSTGGNLLNSIRNFFNRLVCQYLNILDGVQTIYCNNIFWKTIQQRNRSLFLYVASSIVLFTDLIVLVHGSRRVANESNLNDLGSKYSVIEKAILNQNQALYNIYHSLFPNKCCVSEWKYFFISI